MQIELKDVSANYQLGPIRKSNVLNTVNLTIESGTFTALIGRTGAGKSSLLKILNGLLLPTKGSVRIGETVIKQPYPKKDIRNIRKQVGMVFQFPESQLFAETVEKDICFGPMNFGVPLEEAKKTAKKMIELVGLEPSILSKSPFSLSGGQKRRVAIAGILAMEPAVLVLDEPGAGLDPQGKKEIMSLISSWHQQEGLTTILVTHDMEDVALYADRVILMDQGKIIKYEKTKTIFTDSDLLESWGLELPQARRYQIKIEQETGMKLPKICLTLDELADALVMVGLV
ncbi:energy-coupling factor transporter ATPase [Niallia sp. Sow4_A1]|uniref:Energy-coupling factor transporter ATP-binding protein EcfA2 n=1 Tax=Niallia hominis TaxID=3133173 RepID=A0ABV1F1W2_9BACI|nr:MULTISPECIES: energy-coupling factor transporter ATPase [Bacillaceae]MCF2647156.1 energy-coupling factor transporter ATPase [Niallia circulans]MCM3361418.1 energy-coupling factor transporter ATPase [Niallia sp. MER TA 168]REB73969.1 energy-coupling factor transporter ATPase [Cutibacterium acnes]